MATQEQDRPLSFTILGSYSGRNAGDAAIMASIMKSLSNEFGPETVFEIPTTNPAFVITEYAQRFRVKPISILPWTGSIRLLGLPTLLSMMRTDITLITNGIIFDINLFNPLFNFLICLYFIVPLAHRKGKKIACYDVGVGPLRKKLGRMMARKVVNLCECVMVRDPDSQVLLREIGVTKDITITADAVFDGWAAPPERAMQIADSLGFAEDLAQGRVLGWNVTRYVDKWLSQDQKVHSPDSFLSTMAEVIVKLRNERGIKTVLTITQHMDMGYGIRLQERVAELAKGAPGFTPPIVSNKDLNNHDIMSISSMFRMFVGMRLHSLIISAQGGTPVAGLVYAPKVNSLLKQLGTPQLSFQIKDISSAALSGALLEAWDNSHEIKERQQEVVEDMRKRARDAARQLRAIL
jgi:polysaccharide pyruvyl transferase WcaK-like protein